VQPALAVAPLGLGSCGPAEGVTRCDGTVTTWDGVPLDTTVALPAGGGSGLPLVVEIHGFGNSKYEYLDPASQAYTGNVYEWAKAGYAVLSYTARGEWGSCGTPESRSANLAACATGYIHLADARYEARDTQTLIGRLVDEGVADPARIGVTGDSYGGGQSFELAALRDRVMLPDGSLVPWQSPVSGTPLRLAAAAPVIPWTSLVGAIAPNGRTSATAITPAGAESNPVGVFKTSIANAILAAAQNATGPGQPTGEPFVPARPMGFIAPLGVDPEADVLGWVARSDQGEPYSDAGAQQIVSKLERFHSAYGIDSSSSPPPLFVGAGFTDDIFPVDETLRFVNRMRRDHPGVPLSLLFGDFGHQRAANKPADRDLLLNDIHAWFDHYVRGDAPAPAEGVTATTQTCPRTAPSEGPFQAPSFAELASAEVRFSSVVPQTISGGGDSATGLAIDPVAGMGDGCAQADAADASGTATYRLPAATGGGFTLLGAPRISARLAVVGAAPADAQVDARLWDVFHGTETLVARGTLRPSGAATDTWELHPNGWRFAPGHVPKLELLSSDAPYARPSNASFSVDVQDLDLRLPIREGGLGAPGSVCRPRPPFKIKVPRRLRHVRVTVAGRRVAARGRRATIDLRAFGSGVVRVKVTGRTRAGKRYKKLRRYRVCAPA
jgi:hypothetical protein